MINKRITDPKQLLVRTATEASRRASRAASYEEQDALRHAAEMWVLLADLLFDEVLLTEDCVQKHLATAQAFAEEAGQELAPASITDDILALLYPRPSQD